MKVIVSREKSEEFVKQNVEKVISEMMKCKIDTNIKRTCARRPGAECGRVINTAFSLVPCVVKS
jgi:hypothetical protein